MRLNMTTEMDPKVLIQKIEENRARHEGEYSQAREAFWIKAQAFAEKTLERVVAKDEVFLKLSSGGSGYGVAQLQAAMGAFGLGGDAAMPTPPPCHLASYDQALEMVRAHTGEKAFFVELDHEDFSRLVLDKWEWSGNFRNSFAALTG